MVTKKIMRELDINVKRGGAKCQTCKAKAVRRIDKARQPVSSNPKSRLIGIPIIQAMITHKGT